MSADADPYTDTIPGFVPTEQMTREWARETFGDRLTDFARQLADRAQDTAPEAKEKAA